MRPGRSVHSAIHAPDWLMSIHDVRGGLRGRSVPGGRGGRAP